MIRTKWASGHTVLIRNSRNEGRLCLTKRELTELRQDIDRFLSFYSQEFAVERIDEVDDESWKIDPDEDSRA